MAIDRYLAMTAAEIASSPVLPPGLGYMACHFSPYGTGLTNRPATLPANAMLILNDRTPIHGHDPERITAELRGLLSSLRCGSVLLDFQRPGEEETAALANAVSRGLDCPVGVSSLYAGDLPCPVLLPPVPPDTSLRAHLAPWQGRDIWLEAALEGLTVTLTPEGAVRRPLPSPTPTAQCHRDEQLRCRYHIRTGESLVFTLWREPEDLDALLAEAAELGVSRAVGLYQELGHIWK